MTYFQHLWALPTSVTMSRVGLETQRSETETETETETSKNVNRDIYLCKSRYRHIKK